MFSCAESLLLRGLFSSCRERGPLSITVPGLLISAAALGAERRLWGTGLQYRGLWAQQSESPALEHRRNSCGPGLAALWHVGASWTRDRTRVPGIGRRVLHHWAARETPNLVYSWFPSRSSHIYSLIPYPSNLFSVKRQPAYSMKQILMSCNCWLTYLNLKIIIIVCFWL